MKITFTKDCPPILYSGWSAYKEGDQADLRHAQQLIDSGYARAGWGEFVPPLQIQKDVDYAKLSEKAIKALAKERGIKVGRKKKETLIKELSK